MAEDLPGEQPAEATVQSALAGPHKLRIATYNIHGGGPVNPALWDHAANRPLPGYDQPYEYLATIAAQIRSANADVVLLQEVLNHHQSGGCDDQPTRLIQLLGDIYPYTHYAPDYAQAQSSCFGFWSVTAGQMILSKLPLNDVRNTPLEQPRGRFGFMHAQSAKVWKDGVAFRIYNTHFSTVPEDIVAGFKALRAHIDATVGDAIVLAGGDFNWASFDDPVTQFPMASRPLFHHGEGIDHLWSDWPTHDLEDGFEPQAPWAASDHPMRWWDLSWVGDEWITLGLKRAWGFGMNSASAGSGGNIYARNASTPVRVRKSGITDPWIEEPRLGNPNDADPGFRLASIPGDPYGCELVGWRNGRFTWALETGPSCVLSPAITTAQQIQSAPAVVSFQRWLLSFPSISTTLNNYFVFTNLNSGGTFAWSHYEGLSPTPQQNAFTTWNVHTDGAAKQYSSPAVVSLGDLGGCMQIFIRDTNDRLETKSLCYDGGYRWSGWTNLDWPSATVHLASSPSAAVAADGTLHVCVIGDDKQVWCRSFFNNAWESFRSCGAPPGGAFGDPVVTLANSGDLTVYVRGKGNRISLRRCNR